jgi:hypothetical protein
VNPRLRRLKQLVAKRDDLSVGGVREVDLEHLNHLRASNQAFCKVWA